MNVRLLLTLLLVGLLGEAHAQSQGASGRLLDDLYFEGSMATVLYYGDRPWPGGSGLVQLMDRSGPAAEWKVGLRKWETVDLALAMMRGTYPGILASKPGVTHLDPTTSSDSRTTILMESRFRLLPYGRWEPVVSAGWGVVRGKLNGESTWGGGPTLGLGVYRPIGRIEVGLQLRQHLVIPDNASDRAGSGFSPDALPATLLGIRYSLPRKTPRLSSLSLSTPGFLDAGEEGVFMIDSDLDLTAFVVRWDLGDGTTSSGYAIRHAYQEPGTYPVTAHVSTEKESLKLESRVAVRDRIVPASISSISHTPHSGKPGDTISFSANLRGTDVECLWAFGDGASSTSCDPDHVFSDPGAFRVLLSVMNGAGNDTRYRTVRISADECAGIDRLGDVHFRRHSEELVLDMRELLRANFSSAARCPDRVLVVSGFAFETERDAEELAMGRAQAVLQYYLNLGLATRSVRLGQAVIQSEEGWAGELWQGRKTSTALVRE